MSYVPNKIQQVSLNDRFNNLTEKEKKAVLGSWAKPFAEVIFPSICEDRFAVLYSSNKATRPNTPINIVVGAMMIQEIVGMTDDEVLEGLCCDVRMQYALHTTSWDEQPMSDRTLSRFRQRLYEHEEETGEDLVKEELLYQADNIAKFMDLQPYRKRMDSLMIASGCCDSRKIEVTTDGAFASEENRQLAAENGIIFVTTSLTGTKPPKVFADFVINNEEHQIEHSRDERKK